ncbi:MAG: hypothetical protein G01um1014106_52 [Parcubacteria group bacterium Gr01-1014_106]|nr:MAG: hypothetical protein G01um1014106_52 [Parcubacteria group bacterium Gr01-1014_106]
MPALLAFAAAPDGRSMLDHARINNLRLFLLAGRTMHACIVSGGYQQDGGERGHPEIFNKRNGCERYF